MWTTEFQRTHGRYLHGFLFLADLPDQGADLSYSREAAADEILRLFRSWSKVNAYPPGSSSMAFHDETTAQRALQLGSFMDSQHQSDADRDLSPLQDVLQLHVELLSDPAFYAGENNHGMFQNIALLRLASTHAARDMWTDNDINDFYDLASTRLDTYLSHCFTPDGVHVENSPSYHFMVSRYVKDLLPVFQALEYPDTKHLVALQERAEHFATHIVTPDGCVPPLGDSKHEAVYSTSHRTTFRTPEYMWSISRGREGRPPGSTRAVFPDAGYAIARSSWDENAEWVLFKAGYRSNYHHHCDDLSLLFYAHGRLVLAEAGPYGYDYKDALTKYAFSQKAHNVVLVDGTSQPRVDKIPGNVAFTDRSHGGVDGFDVEGINSRSDEWEHLRRVRAVPCTDSRAQGISVHVKDKVVTTDEKLHKFSVLWHLGEGVSAQPRDHGTDLYLGSQKVMEIDWSSSARTSSRIRRPSHGSTPFAQRFPRFGVVKPGTVLEIMSEGHDLLLETSIRTNNFQHGSGNLLTSSKQSHAADATSRDTSTAAGTTQRSTQGASLVITRSGRSIHAELQDTGEALSAAFYLYEGRVAVRKIPYRKNVFSASFVDLPDGSYRVRGFLRRDQDEPSDTVSSKSIHVSGENQQR
ncbi:heparinase II/III domain-containing protein [Kocuria rhizophila]|uniref:heparinase II/III domain-containing protein n=1 Tax=Kocuria rhizophila TaxID=72000 RepID=UPI0016008091|nr:heparinase II/III family protein [Kocuria rhizophila]MCT1957204.1 heparinase II/III family protein [Kocuria rhizophila]MCT2073663.1 heparinase II/III family protein [Kocuria rhizophila]MDA4828568.1 heparinase II/III family protein [Kocuria rhizophila]